MGRCIVTATSPLIPTGPAPSYEAVGPVGRTDSLNRGRRPYLPSGAPMKRPSPSFPAAARTPLAVLGVAATLLAAGCSSGTQGSSASGGTPQKGGAVTFALPPNATPNWIFPLGTPGH